jgi:hypothetical protein
VCVCVCVCVCGWVFENKPEYVAIQQMYEERRILVDRLGGKVMIKEM